MSVLMPIAAVQLLTTLAFFITTIVSVIFAGQSAFQKKWKEAAILFGVALLPIGTWILVAITNQPGIEGVMSV